MSDTQQPRSSHLQILFKALGVVGLLCILGGFGYAVSKATFDLTSYIIIGVGVLLFLLLFIKAEVANLKYYLHVFVYSAMVMGICVIAYMFARQHTEQIDLTKQRLYSLSTQSEKYLQGLGQDVTITCMLGPEQEVAVDPVRKLYGRTPRVKWVFIDPRKDPRATMKFGDHVKVGDVFIYAGTDPKNSKKLSMSEIANPTTNEGTITNAIIDVTRKTKPKLYFLTGHGEVAYEQTAHSRQSQQEAPEPSLGAFRKFLDQRAMETAQLNLAQTSFVPKDASMVVIAGPAVDLQQTEAAAIGDYLKAGGKALILVDVPHSVGTAAMPNLQGLLAQYGISIPNKIIIDLQGAKLSNRPVSPMIAWYNPDSALTKGMPQNQFFFLPLARPIEHTTSPPNGLQVDDLIKTSDGSFSADFDTVAANPKISPPPESEWAAQTIGVSVSKPPPPQIPNMPSQPKDDSAKGTKLVVFGCSSLIQDEVLTTNQAAVLLMLNSVNWLAEQADQIDVAPRTIDSTPLVLTDAQVRLIFAFSVVLLPALLFFGGISYTLMRRKR